MVPEFLDRLSKVDSSTEQEAPRWPGGARTRPPAHCVRAKVQVHEYEEGAMAIFHGGTRRLARYDASAGRLDRAEATGVSRLATPLGSLRSPGGRRQIENRTCFSLPTIKVIPLGATGLPEVPFNSVRPIQLLPRSPIP